MGGKGGYSEGIYSSNNSSALFLHCGGNGYDATSTESGSVNYNGGHNGGGAGRKAIILGAVNNGGSGGGATHIALETGLLFALSGSKNSVIMVAGGGGGGTVRGVSSAYSTGYNGGAIIGVILILVGTFTAISVVMGAVIILNLLIMFVSEKKRELIIMMINGYSKRSVKKYIYCDTILLSVIGSIIGTVIGVLIGFLTLRMFSSECVILMHRLSIPMCVLCMAVTGLLTATAVMIALRKVDGFKLQDINEM